MRKDAPANPRWHDIAEPTAIAATIANNYVIILQCNAGSSAGYRYITGNRNSLIIIVGANYQDDNTFAGYARQYTCVRDANGCIT
jgi:hypothetical protein